MDPSPPLFVFDGDCGFCRKWARWLQGRTDPDATFVPFQQLDLGPLGLVARDVESASYWVDEQGRTFRGNRSIARALRRGPGGWRMLGWIADLPLIRHALTPIYRLVVRNRHRLPAPD